VSDFRLKVIAETQAAESSLKQVDKVANEATRNRNLKIEIPNYSDLSKNFRDLNKDIGSAANGIKDFYKVASKLPVGPLNDINELAGRLKRVAVTATDTGRNVGDAGDVIKATFNATNKAAETLVSRLTKIALGLYVIKEAAGLVQGAFGGMFNETIGREIKLRETILKAQTTLASTNKVFKNGKEITDPYQKIVTLTGAVRKHIDSIRERSIALAGVTSGEVIEVFGIVASQVGQIGGGLKEAEDLAINFAAALGTFGIPLYQARQEIGSILRGDITVDSYLATALGIRSQDIAKAKTEAGGVVKFLEERLGAAVAGQRIAAEGFSGVVSNIKDLSELVSQNFGAGLLDPLLDSLTKVFDFLFSIRNEMFAISKLAGESIGTVADTVLKMVGGATGGTRQTRLEGGGGGGRTGGGTPLTSKVTSDFGADDALNAAKATVKYVQLEFSKAFSTVYLQISTLLERVSSAFLAVGGGLAMLAKGLLSIKIETFKALIGAIESISPALLVAAKGLGAFLGLWGKFMELPLVQELAQITVAQLETVGTSAQRAGAKIGGFNANVQKAGGGLIGIIGNMIKFQLIMFAISAALSLVMERFSAYKESQDKIANDKRVQEAIRRLATTYKDLGENATEAQKRAKAFEQSLVNQEYDKAIANLEKVKKKLEELRDLSDERLGNWLQRVLQSMNLANLDVKPQKGESFADAVYRTRLADQKAAELEAAKYAKEVNKIAALENVALEAQKRVDLSKEYAELQRQQQNDLFQQRQTLAQKEVEIFRAAGELRIYQMEQANAKLIEGEEGASRTALEALNNYLSVRENGELEIEAAKKDIVIEVNNLEKSIADYRFENEKKIAEIRKRAGENEKAMADARRQAEGQGPVVSAGFRVGSTGDSSGPHLDLRSPTNDKQAVINEAVAIIKAWQQQNLAYIQLSNANIDVKNMTDEGKLRQALAREQQIHGRRSGGGAIDIAVPSGTLVPTPAGTPSWGGRGGWQATSLLTGNIMLHGLGDSVATPGGKAGASAAATPTPALQPLDVAAPSIAKYEEAVRGLGSAMERVRALQAALTEARTVAAFEAIAKAAFPQVQLEGYEDNLFTVQATYDAVAASAAGAFDPERAAITIDRTMKIAAANREVKQITDEIAKRPNITEKERSKLADDLAAKKKNYLADLAKEEAAKLRILAVQRATDFITQTQADTKAIYDNIEVLKLRNQLQFDGVDPAVIAGAEALLLNERRIVEATKLLNEQLEIERTKRDELNKLIATADAAALPALQKKLDDALAEIARLERDKGKVQATGFAQAGAINAQTAAETEPGAKIRAFIGDARRELADLEAVAVRVSRSIGDAIGNSLANGITGLIEGTTTAKQVFGNFLKDIGQMLIKEGTKMIATYIAIGIAKIFAGMGGGIQNAASPEAYAVGTGASIGVAAKGASFANGIATFARGGTFSNSIVSSPTLFKFADGGTTRTGLMGEAGPEAIMPLKRGSDGSLGVQATGLREAMGRPPGGANGSTVLNMSFQSTTINGTEYVSRDQLEAAMAATRRQAAKEGASRGMNMTLDKIQNSPSTRSRVGIR
jgi:lambda family phage tail tape measure protein